MRGKYRQFILRVTADNKDEFVSANVAISPQKTLDVTVELVSNLCVLFKSNSFFGLAPASWDWH